MEAPQQALDALQREINLILEHTGRLFAAAANPSAPEAALARASHLKNQLPVSNTRFQQALDVLDEKLQFTKAVVRRDLAVARNSSVTEAPSQPAADLASKRTEDSKQIVVPIAETASEETATTKPEQPAPPNPPQSPPQPQPQSQTATAPDPPLPTVSSPKKRSSPSLEDGSSFEPAPKKQAVGDDKPAASEPPASDIKLELDTNPAEQKSGDQSSDEKAPDTATFSNTGDLDSLFNDPVSAGGAGGDNGEAPDFSTGVDLNAEFDFGSFSAGLDANASNGNDNINALLPGLEDYANNTAGGEPDFSSFFTADATANADGQTQKAEGAGDDQQNNNGEARDTTFDDIFDMTFDMGNGNQNSGNDFNFDFS